jgi:hypothetical protein
MGGARHDPYSPARQVLGEPGQVDARTASHVDTRFRPEVFFVGRTEGAGLVKDFLGRVTRRCAIVTEGSRRGAYDAIYFDETFTYDDGEIDIWRWAMTVGADDQYVAAEATVGSRIVGQRIGDDYALSFHRHVRPNAFVAPRFFTRFTLLQPDLALKSVKVDLFGLPVASMTAVHRKLDY